jgi:integrase
MASLIKRGKVYYAQYLVGKKAKRVSLDTSSLQLAKEKLRQLESALFRGSDSPLPTKTNLSQIIEKYVFQLKARTSDRNIQKVTTYLRSTFGQITDCLKIKNKKIAKKAVKRPASEKFDLIEVTYLEQLTTGQVSTFLSNLIIFKGISAKTANHYRQNILTLCNWAATEGEVRFPNDKNPVVAVKKYKEIQSDIRFLKHKDIEEQFAAISNDLLLSTMVAMYIYAGLRREEALWLMPEDFDLDAGHHGCNSKCWLIYAARSFF